jgi:lysophospholipid acyltransferase (LPLAT)-like uncharacterized protein
MAVADDLPRPAAAKGPVPKPQPSGVVVPHPTRWDQRIIAWLVYGLIRGIALTLRYKIVDRGGLLKSLPLPPSIYCVWHNRLALCLIVYFKFAKQGHPAPAMAAIVSASRDGGLLAAILECFKVQPVRGSSSRRGRQALLELTTWAERGYDLAITPDGPRGPRYVVQEGVISMSQLTGLPIIPVTYNLRWKITAKSWDRFQIPLPFSRCEILVDGSISVPPDASPEEREARRLQLENALKSMSRD